MARSKLKLFLTTSIIGIFLFAILQSVVGNLTWTWLTSLVSREKPELRFRYFLVDLSVQRRFPLSDELIAKVFKQSIVYLHKNSVERILKKFVIPSLMLTNEPLGMQYYYSPEDYHQSLGLNNEIISFVRGGSKSEPIIDYIVFPPCRELLERNVLRDDLAINLARANSELTRLFISQLKDRRIECGSPEVSAPYFQENIFAVSPKIILLDVENTSNQPLHAISIEAEEFAESTNAFKLFPGIQANKTSSIRAHCPFSPGTLMPGEHILFPLFIVFELFPGKEPYFDLRWKSNVVWETNYGDGETALRPTWYRGDTAVRDRIFVHMRPGYKVYAVKAKEASFAVRPFSPENLTYAVIEGWEVGSCPYVLVKESEQGPMHKIGTILVNAIGRGRKRTETLPVNILGHSVVLEEQENEISYIDELTLRVRLPDGSIRVCQSSTLRSSERIINIERYGKGSR